MGRIGHLVDLGVLFIYFGAFSLGTFAYRLWSYGHHLNPRRADARRAVHAGGHRPVSRLPTSCRRSLPMAGTACMGLFLVAVLVAIWLSRQEEL